MIHYNYEHMLYILWIGYCIFSNLVIEYNYIKYVKLIKLEIIIHIKYYIFN